MAPILHPFFVDFYFFFLVIGTNAAPVNFCKSIGDNSTCMPRFPAETTIVPNAFALLSKYVGYFFFIPSGEHPPR